MTKKGLFVACVAILICAAIYSPVCLSENVSVGREIISAHDNGEDVDVFFIHFPFLVLEEGINPSCSGFFTPTIAIVERERNRFVGLVGLQFYMRMGNPNGFSINGGLGFEVGRERLDIYWAGGPSFGPVTLFTKIGYGSIRGERGVLGSFGIKVTW